MLIALSSIWSVSGSHSILVRMHSNIVMGGCHGGFASESAVTCACFDFELTWMFCVLNLCRRIVGDRKCAHAERCNLQL
jgi:hypothetical protein